MRYEPAERRPQADPGRHRASRDDAFRPDVGVIADAATACRLPVTAWRAAWPELSLAGRDRSRNARRAELTQRISLRPRTSTRSAASCRATILGPGAVAGRIHITRARTVPRRAPTHPRPQVHSASIPDGARRESLTRQGRGPITGDGRRDPGAATAAQYGIGVATIVFNNRSYGNALRDQRQQFGGCTIGASWRTRLREARGFGVAAQRVRTPDAFAVPRARPGTAARTPRGTFGTG
jgi:hypothetical protein